MKKIMSVAVAMAAGIVMATDGIESQNVVGYTQASPRPTAADSKYAVAGNMFVVPAGSTWRISDLKIIGGNDEEDIIKFFKENNTAVVNDAKAYYYYNDDGKWYYALGASGKQDEEIDPEDDVIPSGTAFLCLFNTPGATLQYAGEVITGTDGWISFPRGVSKYGLFNNPLTRAVDLTECKIVGGADEEDIIKFFKKNNTAVVDDARAYYYYNDDGKWYYALGASGKQDEEIEVGDEVIPVGGGFLYLFNTSGAKMAFPAPSL